MGVGGHRAVPLLHILPAHKDGTQLVCFFPVPHNRLGMEKLVQVTVEMNLDNLFWVARTYTQKTSCTSDVMSRCYQHSYDQVL